VRLVPLCALLSGLVRDPLRLESPAVGVGSIPIAAGKLLPPWRLTVASLSDRLQSEAVGVGSMPITPGKLLQPLTLRVYVPSLSDRVQSDAAGVGSKDEQSLTSVWCADFRRRAYLSVNRETKIPKLSPDLLESGFDVTADVLEEAQGGLDFFDNSPDVWPQVAGVFVAEMIPADAEWLARISRSDEIHHATPRAAVEGGHVVPDRRRTNPPALHLRDQTRGGIGSVLHVTHGAGGGGLKLNPQFEAANSGT